MRQAAESRIRHINRMLRRVASLQPVGCSRVRDTFELCTVLRQEYDAGCSGITRCNPPVSSAAIAPNGVAAYVRDDAQGGQMQPCCEICEAPLAF